MTALDLLLFAQQPNFGGGQAGGFGGNPPGGFGGAGAGAGAPSAGAAIGTMLAIYFVLFLVVGVPTIAGMWKAFSKAGQPGWAAIVPFYNFYIIGEISGKGGMYGLLILLGMCIPCINLVALIFYILLLIDFSKAYGQGAGMAIGLWLLGFIFWPILGFGSAEYVGVSGGGGRSRRRRIADDEDDEDDRPRRRRPAEDEDDDDRPRRKPRRDDY